MDIDNLRREYLRGGLSREDLHEDPIEQFQLWLRQAIDAQLDDATAMTVATVDAEGQPSQRIVLLKQVDQSGFVFYTNYASRKAAELAQNPRVSLHFPWHRLERQVKVRGRAVKISAAASLAYFTSRPRESQLAAWASEQSRPVSSRQLLMSQFAAMKQKFADGEIPLPDRWGGFCVQASHIEFWQGGASRLHDRFEYARGADGQWTVARLAP
jgi:pyridoxamine 5'-phosphate oxidase